MERKTQIRILFSSNCAGKTIHCLTRHYDYVRVSLEETCHENPNLSLRQILNKYIITPLQKGSKLVVDDCNGKVEKRKSILALIEKKITDVKVTCEVLTPKHGLQQLLWAREMMIAESLLKKKEEVIDWNKIETVIVNWSNDSDLPVEERNFTVRNFEKELVIQTCYMFDVPGLFIQWQSLYKSTDDGLVLVKGVVKALEMWYSCNACGRIIIIHDGSDATAKSSGVSNTEKESQVRFILKELTSKFSMCPLYLLYTNQASSSGEYCVPPHPGLIAFLFRLHHISLQGELSAYWYHTNNHMKMAEKAGLKHLKASRVFAHPQLASGSQATVRPVIPDMLENLSFISPLDDWEDKYVTEALIPLYSLANTAKSQGIVCKAIENCNRKLFLAFTDQDCLERYQKLYAENATLQNSHEESKIENMTRQALITQTPSKSQKSPALNLSVASDRDLPKWMIRMKKKEKHDESSLEGEPPNKKCAKSTLKSLGSNTVYILSDEELLETSRLILSQSGEEVPTEAEVEQYLSQHSSTLSQKHQGKADHPSKKSSHSHKKCSSSSSTHSEDEENSVGRNKRKKKGLGEKSRVKGSHDIGKDIDVQPTKKDQEENIDSANTKQEQKTARVAPETNPTMMILDDIFGDDHETVSRKKAPKSRKKRISDTNIDDLFQSTLSPEEDCNMFAVPTLTTRTRRNFVPDSSESKSTSASSKGSSTRTVADSYVQDSGSHSNNRSKSSSMGSSREIRSIPDSYVKESSSYSNRGSKASKDSNDISTIADSFVKDSSSSYSNRGSRSTKESHEIRSIPDSFVKDSSSFSNRGSKSSKESGDIRSIPDSFVKDSSSYTKSSKSPKSSNEILTIADSYVKDSESYSGKGSKASKGSSDIRSVPDSFVKDSSSYSHQGSKSSRETNEITSIADSYVKDSLNSSSSHHCSKSSSKTSLDVRSIADSFVQDSSSINSNSKSPIQSGSVSNINSTTVVPDSVGSSDGAVRKCNKVKSGTGDTRSSSKYDENSFVRNPVLDDLI